MAHSNPPAPRRPLRTALDQARHAPGLPFAHLLAPAQVEEALQREGITWRERLFTPLVTLYVFLGQLFDPDPSCRQAVARYLAYRLSQGQRACSADPGAYGKARGRLPEAVLRRLARDTGQAAHAQAQPEWRWRGRPVKLVDGTTCSMPDTPRNQQAYPQPPSQQPGLGFPLVRVVVVFSLAVGTALDAALGRYQGKQQGEPSLWRTLQGALQPQDVLLADRYYCSYWEVARAQACGADVVFRMHQRRRVDFRRGRRLGADDHVVSWARPARPAWMERATYAALPRTLTVREVRAAVPQRGFRTQVVTLVTTLLDAGAVPRLDLAALYRQRWQAELDLRSLKQTLQLDVLRGQSPEMVRKEIWGRLLVYNLIRTAMARAAAAHACRPRELSFKGAQQTLNAFAEVLRRATDAERPALEAALWAALATHRVGHRPNRYEPRARKRRPKPYPLLREPRDRARQRMAATS
jgi:hypothetical protein